MLFQLLDSVIVHFTPYSFISTKNIDYLIIFKPLYKYLIFLESSIILI